MTYFWMILSTLSVGGCFLTTGTETFTTMLILSVICIAGLLFDRFVLNNGRKCDQCIFEVE